MLNNKIDITQIKLELPNPLWNSELAILAADLEKLRIRSLSGDTPSHIFFEIKNIFQKLESLGSARIEGNNTTISELVEKIIENVDENKDEGLREILNIDKAIDFINEYIKDDTHINTAFITELHKIVVMDLKREGSKISGEYRKENVSINKSNILPPDFIQVTDYMNNLFEFINDSNDNHNHLFRVAVAHHYFTFIHPFDNGNGRVVRLLTLSMLIKYGFNVKHGQILNPTAIFCNNREDYYKKLGDADSGNIESWCVYVLSGLREEIRKIDRISNYVYVNNMFKRVLENALSKKYIDEEIFDVLSIVIGNKNMSVVAGDLSKIIYMDTTLKRSRVIKKLKDLKYIKNIKNDNSRVYTISFINNFLFRSLIQVLKEEGFIPDSLNKE